MTGHDDNDERDRNAPSHEARTGVTVEDRVVVDAAPTRESPLVAIRGPSASRARPTPSVLATATGAGLGVLLLSFHWTVAASFGQMFEDFGATKFLPLFTRVALGLSCPLGLGLTVLGLAAAGAHRTRGHRAATVASIALGLAALAGLVGALYEPMFESAGQVQSGD